jgi:transcriptional repressor NrdR
MCFFHRLWIFAVGMGRSELGGGDRVYCPFCRHPDSRVIDSRVAEDGTAIRRRRSCPECGRRFTTQESVILMVAKRSGVTEPFARDKIVRGVQRACQGRPVDEDQLAMLAQRVEETIRARGLAEVPSHEVGLAILGPLRDLDQVAYLRFASVYRGFESLDDFEKAISELRGRPQPAVGPALAGTAPAGTAPAGTVLDETADDGVPHAYDG